MKSGNLALRVTFTAAEAAADLDWQAQARCQYADPDLWFPEKGGSPREAEAVCRSCTVRLQCLDYALRNEEPSGVWGGYNEHARRVVARRYRAGESLEDITAGDDVALYDRQDAAKERAQERERARYRACRQANRERLAASSTPQPQEAAALCASSSAPSSAP